jgi:hypothetical protein
MDAVREPIERIRHRLDQRLRFLGVRRPLFELVHRGCESAHHVIGSVAHGANSVRDLAGLSLHAGSAGRSIAATSPRPLRRCSALCVEERREPAEERTLSPRFVPRALQLGTAQGEVDASAGIGADTAVADVKAATTVEVIVAAVAREFIVVTLASKPVGSLTPRQSGPGRAHRRRYRGPHRRGLDRPRRPHRLGRCPHGPQSDQRRLVRR